MGVYLAYVDESGNTDMSGRGSLTYTLGCILVEDTDWTAALDAIIGFRRFLRRRFGVPFFSELKANYLIGGRGPLEPLGLPPLQRHAIYRQVMRLHAKIGLKTFAVVIDKQRLGEQRPELNPRDVAWDYLLQRLRNQTVQGPLGPTLLTLIHDEGDEAVVQKLARKARRAGSAGSQFGTGRLALPFDKLIEDATPRNSAQSYFVQFADLAAYAAYRRLYPPPAAVVSPIVPSSMWGELGAAMYTNVTERNDFAIVHWPLP